MLTRDDQDLIMALAGCSLETAKGDKDNWIERAGSGGRGGSLPGYIERIACAIMRGGKSKSSAIAIAVSRAKKWAAGGDDVDPKTVAKASKAVAQWEALKAKNAAKQLVKATRPNGDGYLMLCRTGSFNTKIVTNEWRALFQRGVEEHGLKHVYSYIEELYSDFIIATIESEGAVQRTIRVPYTVTDGEVAFGDPEEVERAYVPVDELLTDSELELLFDVLELSNASHLETIQNLVKL